jgi:hypothetical protein
MNSLFILFSEIFDIYPNDNFTNKYIKDGDLDIDIILNCGFLKLNIIYTSIWNFIYNTYPTKKDFIDFINLNNFTYEINIQEELKENKLFQKIINSIFHLKIGVLALFDPNELNNRLVQCITDINNQIFIKNLIIQKIAYRYNVTDYDISLNLIITIVNIIKSQNILIKMDNKQLNVISGSINEYIDFSKGDLAYLNELEKIQYIIYKDNHFILKFIDSIAFILDNVTVAPKLASPSSLCSQNQETLETLEKKPTKCEQSERHVVAEGVDDNIIQKLISYYQNIHNKHILIFSTDKSNYDLVAQWYDDMYNFNVSKGIFHLLPNFCKYSLTISDLIYPEVKSLSKLNSSAIYYLIGKKNNKQNFLLTNKYDKYIINSIELFAKVNVKLEKYLILDPKFQPEITLRDIINSNDNNEQIKLKLEKHLFGPKEPIQIILKDIIYSADMYSDIWNIHIKHPCPVRSSDPRNGILLYINFAYMYFLKNQKLINNLNLVNNYNIDSKYSVIIIDNRPNILSIISILFTMINLNSDWHCRVYTSSNALEYYEKYLGKFVDVIDVELLNQKFHIDIYNKLLTSVDFWDSIDYEKVLIIQDDGILLRKGIDKFLQYDFMGSPWLEGPGNEYIKKNVNSDMCGNGGFSLRTVSKMKDVVNNTTEEEKRILFYNNINNSPEDIFFSKNLKKMNNVKMPSSRDASFFGSEEILNIDSLGIHKVWCYHSPDSIKQYFKKILEE